MTTTKMSFSKFDLSTVTQEDNMEFLKPSETDGAKNSVFSLGDASFALEDSETFSKHFLPDNETVLRENWEINENIQARIVRFDTNEVLVDCLIDPENTIIQSRNFPIDLFKNFHPLKEGKPVIIKTRLKPGAMRIEVHPGKGIVNMDSFENHDNWKSLGGKNLSTKLREW